MDYPRLILNGQTHQKDFRFQFFYNVERKKRNGEFSGELGSSFFTFTASIMDFPRLIHHVLVEMLISKTECRTHASTSLRVTHGEEFRKQMKVE